MNSDIDYLHNIYIYIYIYLYAKCTRNDETNRVSVHETMSWEIFNF